MSVTASRLVPSRPEGGPLDAAGGRLFLSLALWLVLYISSLLLYNHTYHITSEVLIRYVQVAPSVWILEATLPDMVFMPTATSIRTSLLDMQILRGCDGVEAWLMLLAALLVFPMPWRHRGWGLVWGTALIFSLNVVRIVSLFHLVLKKPEWFDLAHGVVWQSLMVLVAGIFVLIWLEPGRVRRAAGERMS